LGVRVAIQTGTPHHLQLLEEFHGVAVHTSTSSGISNCCKSPITAAIRVGCCWAHDKRVGKKILSLPPGKCVPDFRLPAQ
jgi:hypothetical protein